VTLQVLSLDLARTNSVEINPENCLAKKLLQTWFHSSFLLFYTNQTAFSGGHHRCLSRTK